MWSHHHSWVRPTHKSSRFAEQLRRPEWCDTGQQHHLQLEMFKQQTFVFFTLWSLWRPESILIATSSFWLSYVILAVTCCHYYQLLQWHEQLASNPAGTASICNSLCHWCHITAGGTVSPAHHFSIISSRSKRPVVGNDLPEAHTEGLEGTRHFAACHNMSPQKPKFIIGTNLS